MKSNTGTYETPIFAAHSACGPAIDHDWISGAEPGSPASTIDAPLRANDVVVARQRLGRIIRETPCTREGNLEPGTGFRVYLKREYMQVTGSFKERGAANALACLEPTVRKRGVIAASAGNHALGLARHGARLGTPVTLVMPRGAAQVKIERCRKLGAVVELAGADFSAAESRAREIANQRGLYFLHPFDDPAVMAGQGTIGLEILDQCPEVDAIVVPVGGGGLLAGIAVAVKALRPSVRIIAAEPAAVPSFSAAVEHGRPTPVRVGPSFADGLAVAKVGDRPFQAVKNLVDGVVRVSEEEIAFAMLTLFETERTVAEGAGAVALAAVLSGRLEMSRGASVVALVCGANVDAVTFARALNSGLARRERLTAGNCRRTA